MNILDLDQSVGKVESVSDGICQISGLSDIAINSIVSFTSGCQGLIIDFDENTSHAIVIGDFTSIKRGDFVKIEQKELKIPTGNALLGRIIDPLGNPLDGKGKISSDNYTGLENPSKSVFERSGINSLLETGFFLIDSQIPIGRGQRELLIGERKIGKEDLAVSIMVNQYLNQSGVIVVYVTICAQAAFIKRVVEKLDQTKAINNTIFIIASSSDPASLNYLSPLSGMSIAESFATQGKDVLIIFDNLTNHARIYRQISLLLKRAPGREAYPGDIFYLHSKLLERSGKFAQSVGGGSITALPLVETISEDITDYITTNLMSITDGHILVTRDLYHQGRRPAISTELSVSRIGGKAQNKLFRDLSNEIKKFIGRFVEVENLTSFGTELQEETLELIERGKRMFQLLNQEEDTNFSYSEQCFIAYFILSDQIFRWQINDMNKLRKSLKDFIAKKPVRNKLIEIAKITDDSYKAEFDQLINDFISAPETLKPLDHKIDFSKQESVRDILAKLEQK